MKTMETTKNEAARKIKVRGKNCADWEDAFYEIDSYEQFDKLVNDTIKQYAEQAIDRCSEIARYRGEISKVEAWSLNSDELQDLIEEKILKVKSELK